MRTFIDATKLLKSLPEKKVVDERQNFSLTCTGQAGLFLNLTWKKDGVILSQDNTTITIMESGSVLDIQISTLTITNVTPAQSGFYTCTAQPARLQDSPVVSASEVKINSNKYFFLFCIYLFVSIFLLTTGTVLQSNNEWTSFDKIKMFFLVCFLRIFSVFSPNKMTIL